MHLQFGDGSDAAVDDFANLPIGDSVTNADVHGGASTFDQYARAYSVPDENANASFGAPGGR
jgi:hypothetical protein